MESLNQVLRSARRLSPGRDAAGENSEVLDTPLASEWLEAAEVEREVPEDEPLLRLEGVDFSYGPLQTLFGVSLNIPAGSTVALLGTNGAGKSTLLRVIAGLDLPDQGTITFRGQDITALAADARVRLGMTLTEGGKATFPSLTVRENLILGAYGFLRDTPRVQQRLEDALDLFPALRARLDQSAGTLSGGEQQMMALGRALVADPELLMIDELSLGLAPVIMGEIVTAVAELRKRGKTMVLVEQSLNIALSVTDWAYFMEKGEVRFSGATKELLERGDLVRSVFFGRDDAS